MIDPYPYLADLELDICYLLDFHRYLGGHYLCIGYCQRGKT